MISSTPRKRNRARAFCNLRYNGNGLNPRNPFIINGLSGRLHFCSVTSLHSLVLDVPPVGLLESDIRGRRGIVKRCRPGSEEGPVVYRTESLYQANTLYWNPFGLRSFRECD